MGKWILEMKNCIDCDLGNGIVVKGNGGGKKRIEGWGVLKERYGCVFIVELDEDKEKFEGVCYR